jgi:RNA polymerase sigma-70 factor (ECF subfamily)
MEELELIKQAQSGNKKALEQLVKNYENTVYNFSFKICRDKERAENTMQETFLSLLRNINQFKGDSKLSTWLYTVVSNHCLIMVRNAPRHEYTSLEDEEVFIDESKLTDWTISPAKLTENKELKEILDKSIANLAPDYRIIFLLRDVEGLSTEETAGITNLSIAAVKSRLHRARAFLRNELNEKLKYEKTRNSM